MTFLPTADKCLADVLRFLTIDAVQEASSGHPGAPLGLAEVATVLWREVLRHAPQYPHWPNRDRFVLSNGHASMLLYSLLQLSGYDLSINDLKAFRQWASKTPGHPEYGLTPGVETTTGPLGQGLANAVGMALAERLLSQRFNQPHYPLIDHYTYVIVGDGCLMEGISHEVCSLAGTLGLHKLIILWDDNGISIDGEVKNWFSENVAQRFRAYGFHVVEKINGHDPHDIRQALASARLQTDKPVLLCCQTIIGQGAPTRAGTADCHGSPLGAEEIDKTRQALDWPHPPFHIPPEIAAAWDHRLVGEELYQAWSVLWEGYQSRYPLLAAEFKRRCIDAPGPLSPELEQALEACQARFEEKNIALATRSASFEVLKEILPFMPELCGGSADLSSSTLTKIPAQDPYIHYGVREFGMGAMMNGLAVYGGFIPYGGTFLTFIDYAKNALRMAALMHLPVIWVLTHDSIGLGEDGPTHQPIEHIMSLRLMPQVRVWRPADAVETASAWQAALSYRQGPTCLLLSRQSLPILPREKALRGAIARGGYILWEAPNHPIVVILIATGSEVALCLDAAQRLLEQGYGLRVLSLPCWEVFLAQDQEYQDQMLPAGVPRCSVEAGVTLGWERFCGGPDDRRMGVDHYGASAPAARLYQEYGLTGEHIMNTVYDMINKTSITQGGEHAI